MTRLALLAAAAAAVAATALPARATIYACDNAPAHVNCFSHNQGRWCHVWVSGICVNATDLLENIET